MPLLLLPAGIQSAAASSTTVLAVWAVGKDRRG